MPILGVEYDFKDQVVYQIICYSHSLFIINKLSTWKAKKSRF